MGKRYWLRAGIGIGVVYAILFVAYVLFAYFIEGKSQITGGAGFGLALIPLVISGMPSTLLLEGILHLLPNSWGQIIDHSILGTVLLLFVFSVTQWFLVGSFFGWLYGKIKSKKIDRRM